MNSGASLSASVLLDEISLRYSAETAKAVIEGPFIFDTNGSEKCQLTVRGAGFEKMLRFSRRRTNRFANRFPGTTNAANGRIEPFEVDLDHLPLNLYMTAAASGEDVFVRTLDLPQLSSARDLAIMELLATAKEDARRPDLFLKLKSRLLSHAATRDNLMAVVALCRIFQRRPKLGSSYSRKLRKYLAESNREGDLQVFEDKLASLGVAPETPHGGTHFGMLDDTAPVWQQCDATMGELRAIGLETWLNSGTLLGVARSGDLLPHDDDIDLAVMLDARDGQAAAKEFSAIRSKLSQAGLIDTEHTTKEPGVLKLRSINGIQIDLFPCWIDTEDRVFVYPHTAGTVHRNDVVKLQRWKDDFANILMPSRPDQVLASNYGSGWQTPDPHFRFDWKAARPKFKDFIDAAAEIRT